MRSTLIFTLLCVVSTNITHAQGSDTLRLTLDEALEIALTESPTIKIADKDIIKKGYAEKGAYSSLYPQISFSGTYDRTIQKQTMVMAGQSFEIGVANSITPAFSASMPLVSPTLWTALKISAKDVELSIESARSSRIDMVEQVSKAYYTILLAYDTYSTYQENYDNALTNYENIKQKYEAGLSSEYDLLRSDVAVKNVEPLLYDAQNAIVLAHWQLKALMGIDLEIDIACKGTLADYDMLLSQGMLSSGETLADNSDLKQLAIQGDILSKTLKMKKLEFAPTLSLSSSYLWIAQSNDFKFNWNPYSMAGLTLSIPIFSGMKKKNDIRQAQVDIDMLSLQQENLERNLKVSIVSYTNSMLTCIKQYHTAQSNIDQALKGYEIAEKRYELGSGTFIDVNDSRLQLTQARLNLSQSIYNYMAAKASIEKIHGKNR